jgi:hypothetical protein
MYLATLDCATSNPSLSSSSGCAARPKADSRCSSAGSGHAGPSRSAAALPGARFPTPGATKTGPVPPHECFRLDDRDNLQDRRKPSIQLDQEPAVVVRKPDPAMHLAPQNDQLMSEHRILCLKPAFRLEWRDQNGQDEAEQSEHDPQTLGDSSGQSMRIRFSVHTREAANAFSAPRRSRIGWFRPPPPVARRPRACNCRRR